LKLVIGTVNEEAYFDRVNAVTVGELVTVA
jgi:hypothetical protein